MNFLVRIIKSLIYKIILRKVDFQESVEITKVISKGVGISWVLMDNIMLFKNKFPLPYAIKAINVTYYNESGQNIGFMDFEGEIKLKAFSSIEHTLESKMSNVTALFNVARFALFDHVKMDVRGYSIIKLLFMEFKIPVEDIIEMDKGRVQFATDDELEKRKKRKLKRREQRKKRLEQMAERKEALKKKRAAAKKERPSQQEETASDNIDLEKPKPELPEQESSTPDQDKSYLDQ